MEQVKVIHGNITQLEVDAIVNATNTTLLGGSGVDGAIYLAAGEELLAECRALNGCSYGEAKITKGFRLPAKYIIHTAGPVYKDGNSEEGRLLYNCYNNALQLAVSNGIESIAFPCISTGIYHFPFEEACHIALTSISHFFRKGNNMKEILLVCFNNSDYEKYQKILKAFRVLAENVDRSKTLEQLEEIQWGEPDNGAYLVKTCNKLRKLPLNEFKIEDLRIMISQQISLDYLVPIALEQLSDNPFCSGDIYAGDLLVSVLEMPSIFWEKNTKWCYEIIYIMEKIEQIQNTYQNDILPLWRRRN